MARPSIISLSTIQPMLGEYPKRNRRFEDKFSSVLFREATVDFLQNYNGDKPFFAFVSFTSPHDPRMAPKEYEEMFNTEKISIPENTFFSKNIRC